MNRKKIEERLRSLGYFTKNLTSTDSLFIGKKTGFDPEINGPIVDMFCLVSFLMNDIVVAYGKTNVPEKITFKSETEFMTWIKKEFPL